MAYRSMYRLFQLIVVIGVVGVARVHGDQPDNPKVLDVAKIGHQSPQPIPAIGTFATLSPYGGTIAGVPVPPGVNVYSNEVDPAQVVYRPGVAEQMADDLQLFSGACDVVYYDLLVGGTSDGGGTFDVDVELWDGDPCLSGSARIDGPRNFPGIPNDGAAHPLSVTLETPTAVPGTVWLAATFSTAAGGWVISEEAELGTTGNFWSEDNATPGQPNGCVTLEFGDIPQTFAGFWANVYCEELAPPEGACCHGETCTVLPEADCTAGVWQGAFTTCTPSPCLTGACCDGPELTTCSDATEAACASTVGLFHAGSACADYPCEATFEIYTNTFDTGSRSNIALGTQWGDDLMFGPGVPCELEAFTVAVTSDLGASSYDVQTALWTNDDSGTPEDPADDVPLAVIVGTETTFFAIPGNQIQRTLMAGPFTGVTVPERAWLVLSTSSAQSGPLLTGIADVGFSHDAIAVFNDTMHQNEWEPGFAFGGFIPEGCPNNPPCNPAASFRAEVWCVGEAPPGACCDDWTGACTDGVRFQDCAGRWARESTCDETLFDPPCGVSACCVAEPVVGCVNVTPSMCSAVLGGSSIVGSLCEHAGFVCPRPTCIGATGDCSSLHPTVGCQDAVCCERVCTADVFCCNQYDPEAEWDATCVTLAQDCASLPACPSGAVTFLDPPDQTVDAGQPHPPSDPDTRQGIQSFRVEAPVGADNLLCWEPCESEKEESANEITSIRDNSDGTFTITLARPIALNAVTTITYFDDEGLGQTGTFLSQPGNANAGDWSQPGDVEHVLGCLDGASCTLWECDIDRSGRCTPADALRLIDLLNLSGGSSFDPWMGTPRPSSGQCP